MKKENGEDGSEQPQLKVRIVMSAHPGCSRLDHHRRRLYVCLSSAIIQCKKSNHLIGGPAHDWNEEDVDKLDDITEEEQMRDLDNDLMTMTNGDDH